LKKVLILTYYWPPSGGSGVQRWMYFCKYLPEFGFEPIVITADEKNASYKFTDVSFLEKVKDIRVLKTNTLEPLKLYSKVLGGDPRSNIPLGFSGEDNPSFFQKLSRFIRGNFFIPDARIGWNIFAYPKAAKIIENENINIVITTGPPHSTHLIGLKLKNKFNINWISDFRDPWSDIYYNELLYRTKYSNERDKILERKVLQKSDMIVTIGPSMRDHLVEKLPEANGKIHFIYNGFDPDSFKDIRVSKRKDKFTVCHIGILSNSQPITSLLEALARFYSSDDPICKYLKLQFVGKVSPSIVREIKEKVAWTELELINYLPHRDTIQFMLNADLLFNSLAEMNESKLLISGKLMEYIATGNPILCLGNPDGDAAKLLRTLENSEVFDRSNIDGIHDFILNIFDKWKNNINLTNKVTLDYTRYETTKQLSQLIRKFN